MSDFDAEVLYGSALQVLAWQKLQDPEIGGRLDPDGILELCKQAGFSEEEAQKTAQKRAEQRLDAQAPMFGTAYVHQ